MTVSEDQLGFTLPIGGDYEGATVTLTYSAGIDYTVGNTEPGTTGYAYDNNLNNPTTLTIENGKVTWHYTLPADVTEDMISLTVTVILEKGDCRDRIQKNLKTVTPPTQPTCLTFDHQYQNVQVNVTTVSAKILDFDPTKIYQLKAEALSIKTTDPDYPEFGLDPQIVSLDLVNADGILTWSLPTTATPSFDGAIIEMRGQFTIYGDENTPCDEFGFETQATPAQELVCPVLSQITIGTTYNYSATISNYDEHAGAFEVEYRVYQVGSTSPMVPSVYENNLSFTQGDQSGVITVSGQMSDAILNQYDQISKIEVFLVYTPSDLFGQCHKDSVYATIYEATPAQECAFSVSQEFTLVDNGYRLDVYNNTGDANAITGIEAECYWHGTDDNVRAESGGTNAYDNPRFQRFSDPQDETHAYYIFYLPDPNYATPNPTTTASIDLKVTFRLKSAYSICNTPDYDGIHREKLDIPYQN
jgi:hypothetical protein